MRFGVSNDKYLTIYTTKLEFDKSVSSIGEMTSQICSSLKGEQIMELGYLARKMGLAGRHYSDKPFLSTIKGTDNQQITGCQNGVVFLSFYRNTFFANNHLIIWF